MTHGNFEQENDNIRRTLKDVSFELDVLEKRMLEFKKQRQILLDKLFELNLREQINRHRGMQELIRMCNTPVWRYRPRNG